MVKCTLSITHCLRLNLQLHTIDLVRTCRKSSFCIIAWQLARFQLTRRIARSLGDSWASCNSTQAEDTQTDTQNCCNDIALQNSDVQICTVQNTCATHNVRQIGLHVVVGWSFRVSIHWNILICVLSHCYCATVELFIIPATWVKKLETILPFLCGISNSVM